MCRRFDPPVPLKGRLRSVNPLLSSIINKAFVGTRRWRVLLFFIQDLTLSVSRQSAKGKDAKALYELSGIATVIAGCVALFNVL